MTQPTTPVGAPLSQERVREIEQMLSAVTPGPWTSSKSFSGDRALAMVPGERLVIGVVAPSVVDDRREAEANAAFLAASPTIVAELLADRTALSARVAELEAAADAEREKAAKVCESRAESLPPIEANEARKCARAIRAKGFASPFRPAIKSLREFDAKYFPDVHARAEANDEYDAEGHKR